MALSASALTTWLEPRLETYVDELRQLCAIECPTSHKPGVDQAGAWVRRWAAARGWELEEFPDEQAGDGLVASLRGAGRLRVMLVAHLDTVYPVGVAAARPMRREGGKIVAPGRIFHERDTGAIAPALADPALRRTVA